MGALGRGGHPRWVPPQRRAVRRVLDPGLNPFFRNARVQLRLAERDGSPLGWIAAIENGRPNDFHGDRTRSFGWFERADDGEAARSLFQVAGRWLRDRQLTSVMGPVNPSTTFGIGRLMDRFEHLPASMSPWSRPYYPGLMDGAGFVKAEDLLTGGHRVNALPDDFERHLRLLPPGWLRILLARRPSAQVRSMHTGVLDRYRKKGFLPVILLLRGAQPGAGSRRR